MKRPKKPIKPCIDTETYNLFRYDTKYPKNKELYFESPVNFDELLKAYQELQTQGVNTKEILVESNSDDSIVVSYLESDKMFATRLEEEEQKRELHKKAEKDYEEACREYKNELKIYNEYMNSKGLLVKKKQLEEQLRLINERICE